MEQPFVEFEWDPAKAKRNIRKHRVSFREAAMVFNDVLAITIYDRAHSSPEQRLITMGMSDKARVLVVSHTAVDDKIRIISARKATRRERNFYEKENA